MKNAMNGGRYFIVVYEEKLKSTRGAKRGYALSRPGRPGLAKELDFLEMILQIQADSEKLDVVGADRARYRFASVCPQIRGVTP